MKRKVQIEEEMFLNIIIKLFVIFLMLIFFTFDYITVNGGTKANVLNVYYAVMAASLFFFILTFFQKIKIVAYMLFMLCLTVYAYMYHNTEEIIERRRFVNCLEIGKVYDPVQKICRDDCWKWDDKSGCLKEEDIK